MTTDSNCDPVILINGDDMPEGTASKLEAHTLGLRHRAVSVLVADLQGNLLLQRRHPQKYHSGGLWTNTCCGHPRPGEDSEAAAYRRLGEEMGFKCLLAPLFTMSYRARVSKNLIENEIVHVYGGIYEGFPAADPLEVIEWKWMSLTELLEDEIQRPNYYTTWFSKYLHIKRELLQSWVMTRCSPLS
jgi:isopentenyl-diphosphate Delta-isomerase